MITCDISTIIIMCIIINTLYLLIIFITICHHSRGIIDIAIIITLNNIYNYTIISV